MAIKIPSGKGVYSITSLTIIANGLAFSDVDLNVSLDQRLPEVLADQAGKRRIQELLDGLAQTAFDVERINHALQASHTLRDWQVGEAIAEAYLVDHRECEFPWPTGRDLRNPEASPAGADLVGFQTHKDSVRFVFGEVKTSAEEKWPPQVMTARHGLTKQLEELRDSRAVKDHLAIVYLGHRASRADWELRYRSAVSRYLANDSDVSLFGFLIRDVEPKADDLSSRAALLSHNCPADTSIELLALYIPRGSITALATRALAHKGGTK